MTSALHVGLLLWPLALSCARTVPPSHVPRELPATDLENEQHERPSAMFAVERAELLRPSEDELVRVAARFPRLKDLELRGSAAALAPLGRLETLERLTITDATTIDMDGLGRATSLRELKIGLADAGLDAARIRSLAPLGTLRELSKLTVVAPRDALRDLLETLPQLPELRELSILANGAEEPEDAPDLERLLRLPNLKTLEIGAGRRFVRLDGIENTRVSTLVLREAVASLEPLVRHSQELWRLGLHDYGGAIPPGVKSWAWLHQRRLIHLDALAGLVELRGLEIVGGAAVDLAFLRSLRKLERLSLRATAVGDISALQGAPLCHLDVAYVRRLPLGEDDPLRGNEAFLRLLSRVVEERSCDDRCSRDCSVNFDDRISASAARANHGAQ